MIIFNTNHGPISIELDSEKAPKSAENFLQYAKEGFYNGTIFHRVIDGFMIQGGGFEPGMSQKANHDPIDNEADNGSQSDWDPGYGKNSRAPFSNIAVFYQCQ